MALQHLRSSTASKRPTPASMADGQLALNTNSTSPGLFYKDSAGDLVKVGPVHVGTTAPNATPASGGQAGNSIGEQWLDTSGGTYVFKVWDGSAWRSETGTFVDVNGDTMTGALGIIAGTNSAPGVFFSGDTNTGIYSPGADQVAISTGGSGRLFVDASGNVGIGTTTPTHKLSIEGTTYANSSLSLGRFTTTASSSQEIIFRKSNSDTQGTNTAVGTGTKLGGILFSGANGTTYQAGFGIASVTTSDWGTGTYSSALTFTDNASASERLRITSSGLFLLGTSASIAVAGGNNLFQTFSSTSDRPLGTHVGINGTFGPNIVLSKSRNTTFGSYTAVQSGDTLGAIQFAGDDGTDYESTAASIKVEVDGTPGANDMPGRIALSTTADGASSPTERLRITQKGALKVSSDGSYLNAADTYHEIVNNATSSQTLILYSNNASFASRTLEIGVNRAANTAYTFFIAFSNAYSAADTEFNLRGDGNAFADGTWSGGGADYAEYFEWSDSNPDAEDRRGISVVLDGDKIREAQAGEDPIGVISGNPSVVGDAAWNKWSGKYLRDEFGSYLLDENGDRQLNPAFEPDAEYIPREQRPEWDCVGLMGKLRIRKGQVTGSRWIKMRDISDTVEEWLVR